MKQFVEVETVRETQPETRITEPGESDLEDQPFVGYSCESYDLEDVVLEIAEKAALEHERIEGMNLEEWALELLRDNPQWLQQTGLYCTVNCNVINQHKAAAALAFSMLAGTPWHKLKAEGDRVEEAKDRASDLLDTLIELRQQQPELFDELIVAEYFG